MDYLHSISANATQANDAIKSVREALRDIFGDKSALYIDMWDMQAKRSLQDSIPLNAYITNTDPLTTSIIYAYFCAGKNIIDRFSSDNDVTYSIDGKRASFAVNGKEY